MRPSAAVTALYWVVLVVGLAGLAFLVLACLNVSATDERRDREVEDWRNRHR